MRIISGTFKGHPIKVAKSFKGRPTTDFARESLFNVLQHQLDLSGSRVLDLFSGTGAFSLECFSRGAEHIVAVELNGTHVAGIKENVVHFGAEHLQVQKGDAFVFLQKTSEIFDLVFCDPPFDHPQLSTLPDLIFARNILNPGGLAVVEHPKGISFSGHRCFQMHKNYGHVHFSFFRPSST